VLTARVRHARTLYDLIRIDHVVGIYRTFNFGPEADAPGFFTPVNEKDQHQQGEEIIRLIKSEAGETEIIAEDLGTVPPWVRLSLTSLGIAGYKVMQWEREYDAPEQPFIAPANYPEQSLATTGTHDTESLTTWWREQSVEDREKLLSALGLSDRINARRIMDEVLRDAVLSALYAAPSRLVIMPIQDLFGWSARINLPGTTLESNWTYRLPLSFERLRRSHAIQDRIAKVRDIAVRSGRFEDSRS
jgi:4-alpha-glucanotransferase